MKNNGQLCAELAAILAKELANGNSLIEKPVVADWPKTGSVFAHLAKDLTTPKSALPDIIEASICNDPHYGWYQELCCRKHQHLLVAGSPKPGQPMWTDF
ncbi:hypothetical protein [Pseudoduganella violaceinigra]|uniref:hypothetical protein n=1 Tax=Pseudoduganella violaceinigra TaxID=246602 RepID=UPI000414475A|nr:hypothetical protein [Pseudoduganella violaceinigra]